MEQIEKKEIWAKFIPDENLIHIRFGGLVNLEDYDLLMKEINTCLSKIQDGARVKLYADLYGFKAENFEVHKKFRLVIPEIMIEYGMLPGYSKMFPEVEIKVNPNPRFNIVKAVHCHNDEEKINRYHKEFASINEEFFCSQTKAKEWIN